MLQIAIVGAGIGGLTAALALADIGCRVSIFEQSDVFRNIGAGIQLAPNATRILQKLGVLTALNPLAVTPSHLEILDYQDGRELARMNLGSSAEKRWGAPSWVVHRADLQKALLDAVATRPTIQMYTNAVINGFTNTIAGIGIHHAEIGNIVFDALIGADGLYSKTRDHLFGAQAPIFSRRLAWRNLIPTEQAPDFARASITRLWLGPRAHLVHYPVRGGTLINVVAITTSETHLIAQPTADIWDQQIDTTPLSRAFEAWHRTAKAVLAVPDGWRVWPLLEKQPLAQFHKGRVALLGDAAHPMLPFMAQGSAQAIEDASGLACSLQKFKNDIPTALAQYSACRAARAAKVQALSRQQGQIYHLSGVSALARNLAMGFMGSERLARRSDWLYGHDATRC